MQSAHAAKSTPEVRLSVAGNELKTTWGQMGLVAGAIGVIFNGVQWFILSLLEPALTLYEIIGRTLPLTIALTVFVLGALNQKTGVFHPAAAAAIFLGAAMFSILIGAADSSVVPSLSSCASNGPLGTCQETNVDHWASWPFQFIWNYWQIYGPKLFISSGITAGFISYSAKRLSDNYGIEW